MSMFDVMHVIDDELTKGDTQVNFLVGLQPKVTRNLLTGCT
jgi:hypothetical protein